MSRKKINPAGIPSAVLKKDGFMDLNAAYEVSVAELGIQQSKRDQIIGLFLTIISFLVPFVIAQTLPDWVKGALFCCIYCIGLVFCFVILRYRIYKECYWIACRVLLQLNHIQPAERSLGVIRTLYFHALKNNYNNVVISKKNPKKGDGQPARVPCYFKTWKKQIYSAETLLFETLAIVASLAGLVGGYYLWLTCCWLGYAQIAILLAVLVWLNAQYIKRLSGLYECVQQTTDDLREQKLNTAFKSAWMLHCSVDDILTDDAP